VTVPGKTALNSGERKTGLFGLQPTDTLHFLFPRAAIFVETPRAILNNFHLNNDDRGSAAIVNSETTHGCDDVNDKDPGLRIQDPGIRDLTIMTKLKDNNQSSNSNNQKEEVKPSLLFAACPIDVSF